MNPSSVLRHRPFGVLRLLALCIVLLATAACSGGSGGGGGGGGSETPAPAGPDAAALLAAAKSNLETLSAQDHVAAGDMIDAFKQFDTAYQADTTSQEAAFYTGLGSVLLFLDSASTTAFLSQLGLADFRTEADRCRAYDVAGQPCPTPPFNNPKTIMIGGSAQSTADYVRLSLAQVESYFFSDLLGAIASAANVLSGIGPSFAGTFQDLRENKTIEVDAADAYVVRAFTQFLQLGAQFPELWNLRAADLDAKFDTTSALARVTTGPTTGDFVDQTAAKAAIEDFYVDTTTLASNPTGLAAMKTLLSGIFGSFHDAAVSLLGETDDQSNDFFTIGDSGSTPTYDKEADASRFSLELSGELAGQLQTAFDPTASSLQTLTLRDAVATITDFGQCAPVTGQPMDSWANTRGGPFFSFASDFAGATPVGATDGVTPNLAPGGTIGIYYVYRLPLTAAANLSIWTADSTPANPVHTEVIVAYSPGTSIVSWDNDSNAAGNKHGGISIASNYFGDSFAGLPSASAGLDLYIFVQAWDTVTKLSSANFNLYVWSGTASTPPAGVPIFLQGRGRNFRLDVYKRESLVDMKAALDVMSEFFQNSNRLTFRLDDPSTTLDESFLEMGGTTTWTAEVQRAAPAADVAMVDSLDDSDAAATNLQADDWEVTGIISDPVADSSIPVPSALQSFCAYPYDLGQADDYTGGFQLK